MSNQKYVYRLEIIRGTSPDKIEELNVKLEKDGWEIDKIKYLSNVHEMAVVLRQKI